MKKYAILLVLCFAGFALLQAQNVTLNGKVTDQLTGQPIPNHPVYIMTDSSSGVVYWGNVTTDVNGDYQDTLTVPPNAAVDFYIYTYDCVNQIQNRTVQRAANGTLTGLPANFSICDSVVSGSCSASFTTTANTGNNFSFASTSTGSGAIAYQWNFGDGTTLGPNTFYNQAVHTYNQAGTYLVCLTITDSASCTSTFCDTVVVTSGSCQSFYTYTPSIAVPNRVFFYGSPTPNFGATFAWDMGDGNTYTTRNVVHNYQNAGTYLACLTVTYAGGCTDTYCDSIVITRGAGPCDADFTITPDSNTTHGFVFTNTSYYNNTPAQAYWTFGDGSTSRNFLSAGHTYWANGTFTVCLYITSGTCTDSICKTVTVTSAPPSSCSASFLAFPDSTMPRRVYFTSTSTATGGGTPVYSWDYGDGASSSGTSTSSRNPVHTYNAPGTYTVCHIISTGTCADTTCQTITVGGTPAPVWISGNIMTGSSYAQSGAVYLIEYDSVTQTLTAVDTTFIDSLGTYYFQVAHGGSYTVKAALDSLDPGYANYLPTYYGDSLLWSGATYFAATQNRFNTDINLVAGNNPGGPGFIGGSVQQGANKDEGDPVGNTLVLLLDVSLNPVTYTYSASDGKYEFANLPYGTYYIHPEVLGLPTTPLQVTLSANNPSVQGAIMEVHSNYVGGFLLTGVKAGFGPEVSCFPNPTRGMTRLTLNLNQSSRIALTIADLSGKVVFRQAGAFARGDHALDIDLGSQPAGVYFLRIRDEAGGSTFHKILKH